MEGKNYIEHNNSRKSKVHHILAHSYTFYLILFLVGVCLDVIFRSKIFTSSVMMPVGIFFLIFASFLILWAQKTSRNFNIDNLDKETFSKGPYRYTRNPTHWGLLFLMIGFGIISNAIFVILFTLIYFLLAKFIFLKREEEILEEKYGAPYLEYKKSVSF